MQLLGQAVSIRSAADWNNESLPLLLRYHLHYFDDLDAVDADARRDWQRRLIDRWIREHPPGAFPGWDPYPTSLRLVNWIKWVWRGNRVSDGLLDSVATQAAWLARNLERDLLGNHLLANAKALCFAGLLFDGEHAGRWLRQGERLLLEQLASQILPDGGHEERAPAYHAQVLHDLLELVQAWRLVGLSPPEEVVRRIPPMLRWLQVMIHPDGEVAFFNDSVVGQAPCYAHLHQMAAALGIVDGEISPLGDADLVASGYARLQRGGMMLLLDLAAIGADSQPGHAHADTLSFECSLHGRRLIVNSGIDRYGCDAQRQWQRSTAAHSTVEVDGADSSEVWGGFRVARRASVVDRGVSARGEAARAWGAHDGYCRLQGVGLHRREWSLRDGQIAIHDTVDGDGRHRLVSRFYLHPEITPEVDGDRVRLRIGGHLLASLQCSHPNHMRLVPSEYFPAFGRREKNWCLEISGEWLLPARLSMTLSWSDE